MPSRLIEPTTCSQGWNVSEGEIGWVVLEELNCCLMVVIRS